MKEKILTILILFVSQTFAIASNPALDSLEMTIYGYDYKNETDTKRIERLESYLYGNKRSGNITKRIENIQNDIGYVKPQNIKKENNQNSLKNNLKNEF